jgi:hypothetical protein
MYLTFIKSNSTTHYCIVQQQTLDEKKSKHAELTQQNKDLAQHFCRG